MCVAQNCVDGDGKLCTKQYCVTPQRTVLFIVTPLTTSHLTWNAGHITLVHFEDTLPSIKSKAGVGSKCGWLFKGKEQIREENRRKCYSSSDTEFLNDAVCVVTVPITNSVHPSYCLRSSPPAANIQTLHISIPQSILFTSRWKSNYKPP